MLKSNPNVPEISYVVVKRARIVQIKNYLSLQVCSEMVQTICKSFGRRRRKKLATGVFFFFFFEYVYDGVIYMFKICTLRTSAIVVFVYAERGDIDIDRKILIKMHLKDDR